MLNIWKETLNGRVGEMSNPVLNICFQECDFQELTPVINDSVPIPSVGVMDGDQPCSSTPVCLKLGQCI